MWCLLCVFSLLLVQVAPTPAPTATPTAAPSAAPTAAPTPAPTLAALPLNYGYLDLPLGGYLKLPDGLYTSGTYTVEVLAYIRTNTDMGRLFELSTAQDTNAIVFTASYLTGVLGLMNFDALGVYSLVTDSNPVPQPVWTHLAATVDSLGQIGKLYIDGELVASANVTHVTSNTPHTNVFIGHSVWPGQGPFEGRVAEFRFWNLVRTQAQLNASKDTVLVGNEAGLQVYYRFDECIGNTTADLSPNARTGTLYANASLVCACDKGYYYNSSACAACEPGRYTNVSGATACYLCEAGRIGDSLGSTCNNCDSGQFANRTGMSQCDQCDPGRYSGTGAFTACLPCAYGTYTGASGAFQCDTCGNGTYAPLPAATVCLNCTTGVGNATYCQPAPTPAPTANPTATPTRAPTATPTRAPTAQPSAAPTPAPTAPCAMGTSFNGSSCVPCAAGRFADTVGLTTCLPCATGRFSASTSATVCNTCTAGSFGNVTGLTACFPCAVNTFAADEISTACTPCPFGLFARTEGAAACVSEGNVALAVARLNRTELTLKAAPLSVITIEPLTSVSCALDDGRTFVEMFRATGTITAPVDIELRSNTTQTFWPIGRDMFTCVNGSWIASYVYECGGNLTAPLDCTEDLWGKGTLCHFTEFAIIDPAPVPYCDEMPRLCKKCVPPLTGCRCTHASTDNWVDSDLVLLTTMFGFSFMLIGRGIAAFLEEAMWPGLTYARVEDSEGTPSKPSYARIASHANTAYALGVLLLTIPSMVGSFDDWETHLWSQSTASMTYAVALALAAAAFGMRNYFLWSGIGAKCTAREWAARSLIFIPFAVCALAEAIALYSAQMVQIAASAETRLRGTDWRDYIQTHGAYSDRFGFIVAAVSMDFVANITICALFYIVPGKGESSTDTESVFMRFVAIVRAIVAFARVGILVTATVAMAMLRMTIACEL